MAARPYGSGSLYVRTDSAGRETWYGHWRVGGRQVKRRIGVKRQRGERDGLTKAQAESELRELMANVRPTSRSETTLAQASVVYVEHLRRQGRKPSTIVAVRCALDNWLIPWFGDRTLDRIRPEDVDDLIRAMEAGSRPTESRRRKPVGAKSIRNYVGTLSALYRYAMHPRRRWASTNPCEAVELPRVEDHDEIRFLDSDAVRLLATAAVDGPYQAIDRALYLTAAMTGLRQGELLALRWCDVDWPAGRIRVRRNFVLGEYGTPKSRRSTRSVPMAHEVAVALEALSRRSAHTADDELVFGDPTTGRPLERAALMRRYRRTLRAAGVDPTHRFHDLRHTFGTRMAAQGVPMRTLQEWMGHRDIQTTQRYADYAPSPEHERDLVAQAFASPLVVPSAAAEANANARDLVQ